MELLRSLYWSIPDSPKAVATLREWLSKPEPRRFLFGMKDADEIWPQVPQFAPLLAQWLQLPDQAREAAEGLGLMGTNAAFAIPDLIDTFNQGVAGHPPNTNFVIRYSPGMDPLRRNRTAAIAALGHIGIATKDVLAALERGLNDPQDDVRVFTSDAIGELGAKALPLLPTLLAHLDTSNKFVLEYQIEAIGKMGRGAREAIPALRRWADPDAAATLGPSKGIGRVVRWFDEPPPLPAGAAIALFLVAPEEAFGHGKVIARILTPGRDVQWGEHSVDKLRQLRPLAGEIVPELERALSDDRQWVRQLTALQILSLKPDHAEAKTVLRNAMRQLEPDLRAQAASYFWQLTADINEVLPVIRETLNTAKDENRQAPLIYAAELGPLAMPLVPQIQELLNSQDASIRQLAGKALRRIDPKALPPLNER